MASFDSDEDVSDWNSFDPLVELNFPGEFAGRVSSCRLVDKGDGTAQVLINIVPTDVIAADTPADFNAEEIHSAVQTHSIFLSLSDTTTLVRARKILAGLGSETAGTGKGRRVATWVKEADEAAYPCYFRIEQRKARPGYPNIDPEGNPIYTVTKVSGHPLS